LTLRGNSTDAAHSVGLVWFDKRLASGAINCELVTDGRLRAVKLGPCLRCCRLCWATVTAMLPDASVAWFKDRGSVAQSIHSMPSLRPRCTVYVVVSPL